jgi:hypothetical protein
MMRLGPSWTAFAARNAAVYHSRASVSTTLRLMSSGPPVPGIKVRSMKIVAWLHRALVACELRSNSLHASFPFCFL